MAALNASTATDTFNRSRNVVPMPGLCVECLDCCKGGCEMWLASFRGREVICPGTFGSITPGIAIGTAILGTTLVCGEKVCGIDPRLVLDKDGKVKSSPEMDRWAVPG